MDAESWNRITRYALGECTASEAIHTRAWIEQDPERKALAEELIRLADAGPTSLWNARAAWQRFSTPVEQERPAVERQAAEPSTRRVSRPLFVGAAGGSIGGGRRWWIGMAAAAAVILGVFTELVWHPGRRPEQVAAVPAPLRAAVTKRGQTADIYLADGTHVFLGAASTLRFPTTFAATRDVSLEGDAYFDVVHDAARPFSVHTAHAIARDIGTKFGVRAYPGTAATEVVVAEGAVALKRATQPTAASPTSTASRASADSLLLTQADLGRLTPNGELALTHRVDVERYLAWMQGRLEFANTPMRDALPQLSRWYDVELRLGDPSLADARLTASLQIESLSEAVKLIAAALDARAERHGRIVTLYPQHSTSTH